MNLIILPVTINDSITVNLILDTGCRNLVLFGTQFQKKFVLERDRNVRFSGLGDGKPVDGKLALDNKVSIHALLGESIPVVIIPDRRLFSSLSNIHGVIGYDVFIKFEIEFNMTKEVITFRPAATAELSRGYNKVPLQINDSRPLIHATVFFSAGKGEECDLMLDTGSTLGLLFKTSDLKIFSERGSKKIIGRGLNGNVTGVDAQAFKLMLRTLEIKAPSSQVIYSTWDSNPSIGMNILKHYTVVLNYCKAYAGFRQMSKKP
jgi:hypothetical protein